MSICRAILTGLGITVAILALAMVAAAAVIAGALAAVWVLV